MEKNKASKLNILKKVLSIAAKILYDILIFFCIILIVVIVWQRITDSNRSIKGYRLFRIVSGSMVPEYNIDEVVICKEKDINTLKVGDIIVYRGKVGELNGKLVMHEIIDINQNDGELTFNVKGIQNLLGDPNVSSSQILGKVIFKSSLLTYVYALATNTYSSFIIIMVLVINVFIAFRPTRKELDEKNQEKVKNNKLNEKKNEDNFENKNENNVENKIEKKNKVKRYRLKDYKNSIKIIKKNSVLENDIDNKKEEIDDTDRLIEENRKLQEENKILKEKVKKIKEENKKEKDKKKNIFEKFC